MAEENKYRTELEFDVEKAKQAVREMAEESRKLSQAAKDVEDSGKSYDVFTSDIEKAKEAIKQNNKEFEKSIKVTEEQTKAKKAQAKESDKVVKSQKKETDEIKKLNNQAGINAKVTQVTRVAKLGLATASNLLQGNLVKAAKAFRLMSAAMRVSPIGLLTTLVTAAWGAWQLYDKYLSSAARTERRYQAIAKDTTRLLKGANKERERLNDLLVDFDKQSAANREKTLEEVNADIDRTDEEISRLSKRIKEEQQRIIGDIDFAPNQVNPINIYKRLFGVTNIQKAGDQIGQLQEQLNKVKKEQQELLDLRDDFASRDPDFLFRSAQAILEVADSDVQFNKARSFLERAAEYVGFNTELANQIDEALKEVNKIIKNRNNDNGLTELEQDLQVLTQLKEKLNNQILAKDFEGARRTADEIVLLEQKLENLRIAYDRLIKTAKSGEISTSGIESQDTLSSISSLTELNEDGTQKDPDQVFANFLENADEFYEDLRYKRLTEAQLAIDDEEDLARERLKINLEIDKRILQARLLNLEFLKTASSQELDGMRNQIKLIDRQLQDLGVTASQSGDIFDDLKDQIKESLNLSNDDLSKLESAITEFAFIGADLFSDLRDARLKILDNELDAIRDRRNEIEGQIDREKELYENGYANNYETLKQSLEEQKSLEQQFSDEREKIAKKQAKTKFAAETVAQGASLLTASSNLLAALSPLGPAGVAIGWTAIAGMLVAFASLKRKLYSEIDSLYDGGDLAEHITYKERTGETRRSGRVSQYGNGKTDKYGQRGHRVQGTNLQLGGDEFIINSGETQRNISFLTKFNNGKYRGIDMEDAMRSYFNPTPYIEVFRDREKNTVINASTIDYEKLESVVMNVMNKHFEKYKHYDKTKEKPFDAKVIKKGNTTRKFLN